MPGSYRPGGHPPGASVWLRTIEPAPSATTAFIGRWHGASERPAATLHGSEAYLAWRAGDPATGASAEDWLDAALLAFFNNGGSVALVVPLGSATRPPVHGDYMGALAGLETPGIVQVVCLPGQVWSSAGNPLLQAAIDQAERLAERMVLVDPPRDLALQDAQGVAALGLPVSRHAACYYPWLETVVSEAPAGASAPTRALPPSGCVAGVWARIDALRGVWKSPAGLEARLWGVSGLVRAVARSHLQVLNPRGINAIVDLAGRGRLVWGARTLAGANDHEGRYLAVQRLTLWLRESLRRGLGWAADAPNEAPLWASLRLSVVSFLDGLHRAGAFQGTTAREAYFVRCGLGDTMTPNDLAHGRVVVQVGVAPLKPAEFMILRIELQAGR